VDVTQIPAAMANLATGRLQAEVRVGVLDQALETTQAAAAALLDSLSTSVPAGLTFSPSGLSSGLDHRFVADL
jgi:hypothetical protein